MLYNAEKLTGVDPDLVRLVHAVAQRVNVFVVQGARSVADEKAAMASGHSRLKNPLESKHVVYVDRPLALAVDGVPYDHAPTPAEWENIPLFERFGALVKETAAALGIAIVWGGDWAHLKDYDHFEKVEQHG